MARSILLGALAVLAVASVSFAETYLVATEGAYPPYNTVNEKGEPDGYDIAVAKALDEALPDVEFKYQAVAWDSIFAGLEAGRYEFIISETSRTPAREERYLFSELPYSYQEWAFVVKMGLSPIHNLDDCRGKTLSIALGNANLPSIEEWNAKNGNPIKLVYGDGDVNKVLLDVQNGRVDTTLVDPVTAKLIVDAQGLQVDFNVRSDGDPVPAYLLFRRNDRGAALKAKAGPALAELIESGKLAEISKKYLGANYTTLEAIKEQSGE